jgi:hypothetical protein
MQTENDTSKPEDLPEQKTGEGCSGATCSAWVEVSKADFDRYISEYPLPLERDVTHICEPPMLTYNDFSGGKIWPQSIVAKAQLYDGSEYHGGRAPVYFLPNANVEPPSERKANAQ